MRVLVLLCWLLPSLLFAQVSTKAYTPGWFNVPAPTQAPGVVSHAIGGPPPVPPLGAVQIAYTLVDPFDRHSEMSPITTICPKTAWWVVVNPTLVGKDTPAVATCWWYNDAGTWRILGAPAFCSDPRECTRPYVPLAGWQYYRNRGHKLDLTYWGADYNNNKYWWPPWSDPFWKKGSLVLDVTGPPAIGPPDVRLYSKQLLPEVPIDVAYSWACNEGESPLSPMLSFPAGPAGSTVRLIELARGIIPPQGACGMYLYVRETAPANGNKNPWHRQPAPHIVNPQTLDDYLWPLTNNIIKLEQFHKNNIQPAASGRSWLSGLHQAAAGSTDSICVTEPQEICCPIIMPLDNALGNALERTISAPLGAKWNITTKIQPGSPTAWPVWVENSQRTHLVGCHIESATASAGVAFLDHSGSGAFHFHSTRLYVALGAPQAAGILATEECRAWQGHSPSEVKCFLSTIGASRPVVIEWNQSANWYFDCLDASSDNSLSSVIITQSNAGTLTVKGQFTTLASRAVVAAGNATELNIEGLFCDQGHPEYIVCGYRSTPRINVSVRGMNVRIPFLHLITATNPSAGFIVATWRGVQGEPCSDPITFTTRYNGIQLTAEPNGAIKNLVARQPLQANWQNSRYWNEWDHGLTPVPPTPIVVP